MSWSEYNHIHGKVARTKCAVYIATQSARVLHILYYTQIHIAVFGRFSPGVRAEENNLFRLEFLGDLIGNSLNFIPCDHTPLLYHTQIVSVKPCGDHVDKLIHWYPLLFHRISPPHM